MAQVYTRKEKEIPVADVDKILPNVDTARISHVRCSVLLVATCTCTSTATRQQKVGCKQKC